MTQAQLKSHVTFTVFFSFFVLLFLIRLFLHNPLLELDEAEQVIWGQHFLLGYPSQPPLYSWLQFILFRLVDMNIISLALLKYTLLFGCWYYYQQICEYYCANKPLAWCATLTWVFLLSISFDLIKDNTHSVLALFAACLTWYWFVTPSREEFLWYVRLGLIIACGLLAKFNYAIFLLILLSSALLLREYRRKLFHKNIFWTLICIGVFTFPYFYWLINHAEIGLNSSYKITPPQKTQLNGLWALIKACVFFSMGALIFPRVFFGFSRASRDWAVVSESHALLIRYHQIVLPLLFLLVGIGGFRDFETRWLIPILFLSPLLYFSRMPPQKNHDSKAKKYLGVCFLIQCVLIIIVTFQSYYSKNKNHQIPFLEMMTEAKAEKTPIHCIISDSTWLLGNAQLRFKQAKLNLIGTAFSPFRCHHHCLILWNAKEVPLWANEMMEVCRSQMTWVKKTGMVLAGLAR